MQRVVVILAVILLVVASLGVGALAAHWPFWRRAWQWQAAVGDWPSQLSGPHVVVRGGGGAPLDFTAASPDLAAIAGKARTQLLLRIRGDVADAWYASGFTELTPVDGRGLTPLVLEPLFAQMQTRHAGLLDQPIGAWLEAWRQDQRGGLTPRDLFAQLDHQALTRAAFAPLNPFESAAQLASGPDFHRAALAAYGVPALPAPATRPMAAAQLLASVAAAAQGSTFVQALETQLWSGLATGDATLLLDRRRGNAAAHCCLHARAADWLRLGLRLGAAGSGDLRVVRTDGRALLVAPGSGAVLWVGVGEAPSGLEMLLPAVLSGD
jgi:hypothetical protein